MKKHLTIIGGGFSSWAAASVFADNGYSIDIFEDRIMVGASGGDPSRWRGTAFVIDFQQLFPVALTNLQFDATIGDVEYITAQVTFKHQQFFIRDKDFKKL